MTNPFSFGPLAPPAVFILLCLLGALIALVWRRTGVVMVLVSSLCLYAAATPALSAYLLRRVEAELPRAVDLGPAQAIVVLSADIRTAKGAENADTLGPLSLERLYFAAAAYRRLHKPVAVSGGLVGEAEQSASSLMKAALEKNFNVPVTWSEDRSETTWENAVYSARLLKAAGIGTVVVVTHEWHLPRALWSFEQNGLRALPWPAPRAAPQDQEIDDFLPNIGALQHSFYALHELLGGVYYRLRY